MAYRRLPSVIPSINTHGTLASLGALIAGRDDAEYFDAIGGEVVLGPPVVERQSYDLRLYAERQRAVARNTGFSIAHVIDDDRDFRENVIANAAEQMGARLRLRSGFGSAPGLNVIGELSLAAETGDYPILRPEAALRVNTPLHFGLNLELEGAAGTVEGSNIPTQALWRLGGAPTLRGHGFNALIGERYWRVRAELGRAGSISLKPFADVGWAGPNNRFSAEGARVSLGIGLSFMDGLIRLDIARALNAAGGRRLHGHSSWLR